MQTRGMDLRRLVVLLGVMFLLQIPAFASAASDDYPNRPIQFIVGWTAGASDDLRARSLAPKMGEVLGQPVVVVNKPGASATLGMTLVAKSKPDGYTLGCVSPSPFVFTPHMQKVEYNPLTDFTYIAGTADTPCGILVRSDAPWKTLGELVDYIKKNPKKIKYGTWGIGGAGHVMISMVGKHWGLDWVHVPFKGDQPNIMALLGGHVPVAIISPAFVPHVKAGKLRLLAVLTGTGNRMTLFPEVPAVNELGVKVDLMGGLDVMGVCGPKGIPPGIVSKLENAVKQAVESAEFQQAMEQLSTNAMYRDSQAFTKFIHEVYPKLGEAIKELGLSQTEK